MSKVVLRQSLAQYTKASCPLVAHYGCIRVCERLGPRVGGIRSPLPPEPTVRFRPCVDGSDDVNLNALRDEPASQPEPRPTGFVDGDHPLDLMARSCSARSIAGERFEQGFLRGLVGYASPSPVPGPALAPPEPNSCCSALSQEQACDRNRPQ